MALSCLEFVFLSFAFLKFVLVQWSTCADAPSNFCNLQSTFHASSQWLNSLELTFLGIVLVLEFSSCKAQSLWRSGSLGSPLVLQRSKIHWVVWSGPLLAYSFVHAHFEALHCCLSGWHFHIWALWLLPLALTCHFSSFAGWLVGFQFFHLWAFGFRPEDLTANLLTLETHPRAHTDSFWVAYQDFNFYNTLSLH